MPSFGDKLKAEREKRSITLEQISLSTKIGTRLLQALEEDKFNQLPGGIFNKGFVRAYARHLGLDEDQTVADYLAAAGETDPSHVSPEMETSRLKASFEANPRAESPRSDDRGLPWGIFAAVLLVIALALSLWNRHERSVRQTEVVVVRPPAPEATRARTESTAASSATPMTSSQIDQSPADATSPAAAPKQSAQPPAALQSSTPSVGEFTVMVELREDSWLSITADGKTLTSGLLNAGEERSVRGHQLVTVKAGNVGGVDFLFNGKKLSAQGQSGEVKTLTFGPGGLQPNPPEPVSE